MNNDNLRKALEANRRFYAMKFPHIYGKGYNPDEPRDWHGRWTTGGSSNAGSSVGEGSNTSPSLTPANYTANTFNSQGAVAHLNQEADRLKAEQIASGQSNLFGEDRCAHYVGDAIVNGGGLDTAGHWPGDAKDFGPWLEKDGFGEVAAWNPQVGGTLVNGLYPPGYTPQPGDVIVTQPYPGGNPSGHTAMYNGSQWVSDFRQRDMWGGPDYRRLQPSYVIYRYGAHSVAL